MGGGKEVASLGFAVKRLMLYDVESGEGFCNTRATTWLLMRLFSTRGYSTALARGYRIELVRLNSFIHGLKTHL